MERSELAVTPARLAGLMTYRSGFYRCLTGWADALFELTDALLMTPGPVSSIPALSLAPAHRRSHGSLYKALARGSIDVDALRDLQVTYRPRDWPLVFAVDTSSWPRDDAETSPDRGFYHHPSRHSNGKPIVAGWNYSWIAQCNWARDSWTAPLDVTRFPPQDDTGQATARQVTNLVRRLHLHPDDPVPLFVFDAGYDPIALTVDLAEVRAQLLVRIRDDRVFHHPPAPPTGTRGRPPRHGPTFRCADPTSWPQPDHQLHTEDPGHGHIHVQAWTGLHPKLRTDRGRWHQHTQPPIISGTIIRVEVEHLPRPTGAGRVNKPLWLWWTGPAGTHPNLDLTWRAYLHRFDVEHTLRFAKGTLGWTTPSLRTPDQADRWTWLIVATHTQLRLARGHVADQRLPWERPRHPDRLTPSRVRRNFVALAHTLTTPASPPKSRTPGPGRPKGTTRPPRQRHPAVKKQPATKIKV